MQTRILVLDDEKEIADLVTLYLKNEGYHVSAYDSEIDTDQCLMEMIPECRFIFVLVPHKRMMQELEECLKELKTAGKECPAVITF